MDSGTVRAEISGRTENHSVFANHRGRNYCLADKNDLLSTEELSFRVASPVQGVYLSDARNNIFQDKSIDLILTSPAYWKKRDYKIKDQIGREKTPEQYIESVLSIMDNWLDNLKDSGSLFLNLGDSYKNGSRLQIPQRIAIGATSRGWILRDQIIWAKPNSTPDSAQRRLPPRDEWIFHFSKKGKYYYDLHGFKKNFKKLSNIWTMNPANYAGEHLAPFPEELVRRILHLACPKFVCAKCAAPFVRKLIKTDRLDEENRPQAKRAMQIYKESNLTKNHIRAVQAVGISDAGKARHFQTGTDKNRADVVRLAAEAKKVLKGYFREFTFSIKETVGWLGCSCAAAVVPGVVYDPFLGSGTTLRVAKKLKLSGLGTDIKIYKGVKKLLNG